MGWRMDAKLIFTVSCLAAVSLAVFVYAIHHNKKNTRGPSADEKPQRKFKRILADNSHSPFVHFQSQREQNGGKPHFFFLFIYFVRKICIFHWSSLVDF
jgi:hypothetical protein